jgi:hypothetical protein
MRLTLPYNQRTARPLAGLPQSLTQGLQQGIKQCLNPSKIYQLKNI